MLVDDARNGLSRYVGRLGNFLDGDAFHPFAFSCFFFIVPVTDTVIVNVIVNII